MSLFGKGLYNFSGDSLKKWITKIADVPWKDLIVSIVVTAILNSSSAVMVNQSGSFQQEY
ncbi:Na/Pi symporter [Bacillus sp. SA1-12]|uniref:Na/Pi symporter n=1 Tax=Bacillus sp. SA1-12 TaxID=1455638 RepID=UPI000A07D023